MTEFSALGRAHRLNRNFEADPKPIRIGSRKPDQTGISERTRNVGIPCPASLTPPGLPHGLNVAPVSGYLNRRSEEHLSRICRIPMQPRNGSSGRRPDFTTSTQPEAEQPPQSPPQTGTLRGKCRSGQTRVVLIVGTLVS